MSVLTRPIAIAELKGFEKDDAAQKKAARTFVETLKAGLKRKRS